MNKKIPFDWVKFEEEKYLIDWKGAKEVQRKKFTNGIYVVLLDSDVVLTLRPNTPTYAISLIVPTVYKYADLFKYGCPVGWHDTLEKMNASQCARPFHSYLRGEFDGEELINVEIIKR